jgi:fructose-1,6-bisphosphatase/inositol monophosphatase family enzyme
MAIESIHPLQLCLDIATEAALAGGAVLQAYWGKLESIQEKGRPGDLLTEADKASEEQVLAFSRSRDLGRRIRRIR